MASCWHAQIGLQLEISECSVRITLKNNNEFGTVEGKSRSSRPKKVILVRRNPNMSIAVIEPSNPRVRSPSIKKEFAGFETQQEGQPGTSFLKITLIVKNELFFIPFTLIGDFCLFEYMNPNQHFQLPTLQKRPS